MSETISDKEIHTMLSLIAMGDINLIPESKIASVIQNLKDLHAKLEAAEIDRDTAQCRLTLLDKFVESGKEILAEAEKLRPKLESAEKDRDNLQAQLQAAKISIKDREARAEYSADCAVKLANELKGMTEARDTFYNDMLLYKKSCDDLIKFRDEQFDKTDKLTAENTNLQAAYEVVRGALDCIAGLTTHEWENKIARKALKDCSYIKCHVCKYEPSCDYEPHTERCLAKYSKVDQALSTTPEQAGERVRGLVKAAESVRNSLYDALPSGNVTGDRYFMVIIRAIKAIDDAIAKYRGGADNP